MANEQLVLARATPIETVKDLLELQMRREVEWMAEGLDLQIEYYNKGMYYNYLDGDIVFDYDSSTDGGIGPFTLPELHTKLKELTDETQ